MGLARFPWVTRLRGFVGFSLAFLKRMGCMGYHKILMFSTRLSGNTRFQQFKTMKLQTETLRAKTRTLRPLPPSIRNSPRPTRVS